MLKNLAKKLLPPIVLDVRRMLLSRKKEEDFFYDIEGSRVKLPPGHTLAKYQKMHRLFDRFLPVLAKYVDGQKTIIDVGANVGDTAIMMHHHTKADIVCVEPSDKFHSYLLENIGGLDIAAQKRFIFEKSLIGTNKVDGVLTHYDGTAKVVAVEHGGAKHDQYKSLDEVAGEKVVGLIKVDTDGYDYDVLLSGLQVLKRDQPVLFWENQIEHDFQVKGYEQLYEVLQEMGYTEVCIFDNFGGLLFSHTNFDNLRSINSYLLDMQEYQSTRTFFFTDVLAYAPKDKERVTRAIDDYRLNWIKQV